MKTINLTAELALDLLNLENSKIRNFILNNFTMEELYKESLYQITSLEDACKKLYLDYYSITYNILDSVDINILSSALNKCVKDVMAKIHTKYSIEKLYIPKYLVIPKSSFDTPEHEFARSKFISALDRDYKVVGETDKEGISYVVVYNGIQEIKENCPLACITEEAAKYLGTKFWSKAFSYKVFPFSPSYNLITDLSQTEKNSLERTLQAAYHIHSLI